MTATSSGTKAAKTGISRRRPAAADRPDGWGRYTSHKRGWRAAAEEAVRDEEAPESRGEQRVDKERPQRALGEGVRGTNHEQPDAREGGDRHHQRVECRVDVDSRVANVRTHPEAGDQERHGNDPGDRECRRLVVEGVVDYVADDERGDRGRHQPP